MIIFRIIEKVVAPDHLLIRGEGKVFGFFYKGLFKKRIYGYSEYADMSLDKLSWWQRFINKKKYNEYIDYRNGKISTLKGSGEWAGICVRSIRFPFNFSERYSEYSEIYNDYVRTYITIGNKKQILIVSKSNFTRILHT